MKKIHSNSSVFSAKNIHHSNTIENKKIQTIVDATKDFAMSDYSYLTTRRDLYDMKMLNNYFGNNDDQTSTYSAYLYSFYGDTKRDSIDYHTNTKSSRIQSENIHNIKRPTLKLPNIEQTKLKQSSKKSYSYKPRTQSKQAKKSIDVVDQHDLIQNILNYDIYDGKKGIKYDNSHAELDFFEYSHSIPKLCVNFHSPSCTPVCVTPRSSPVFNLKEAQMQQQNTYASSSRNDVHATLLPAVNFKDRYPVYYNFSPAITSDYYFSDKESLNQDSSSDKSFNYVNTNRRSSSKRRLKKK